MPFSECAAAVASVASLQPNVQPIHAKNDPFQSQINLRVTSIHIHPIGGLPDDQVHVHEA